MIDIILIDAYMSDDNIVLPKLDLYPAYIHYMLLIFALASAPRKTENLSIVPPSQLPPVLNTVKMH